ncbi:hypothetical protein fugu_014774 [Takifugu bimaculatus]|uniref:Cytochrome P450 n=1 Tax=Takifugu bimaculatus TaxID=433685 RepID=A0A4Z2C3D0_9TELE|nr:hypothetical protein fugu_014774 [Takifugu bimaculatus]
MSVISMMASVLLILLTFLVALLGALYLLGVFRQRRPGEPPLDKGLIPWLGHVLEFRRNTWRFLERMEKKHGDVFTVQLAGFYITFIQDPMSFGAFVKESREKLDFRKFASHLVRRVFGYSSIQNDHEILNASSNRHLKGDGLEVMTQAMMVNLQNLMLHNVESSSDQVTWREEKLFAYCYNIVFRAGYLSLYGNETFDSKISQEKAKEKDRAESEAFIIMAACISRGNSKDSHRGHDPQRSWTLASLSEQEKPSDEKKRTTCTHKGGKRGNKAKYTWEDN